MDAEAELIHQDSRQMLRLVGSAKALRRLRPDAVVAWTSDPPLPRTTTHVPVIDNDLARIPACFTRSGGQTDRVLLVVHPAFPKDLLKPAFGS